MQNKKAFTLVELIVTIVILTILAGVGFMALTGYTSKARDSQRVESVKNLGEALKMQLMKTDELPTPDNYTNSYTEIDGVEWKVGTLGVEAVKKLTGLEKLPVDPQTGSGFYYAVSKSGNSFIIKTSLENEMKQGGGKGKAKEFVISNFKICGTGYHNDGGACISDLTCNSGEHQEGEKCVADTKDCYISNGHGTQTWNNTINKWGTCENIDCDTGFRFENGICYTMLANCEAQNPYKIYGNLEALNNNNSKNLSINKTENHGVYKYSTKVTCKDGKLTDNGNTRVFLNCVAGYTLDGGSVCINEKQVACAENGAPENANYTSGNVIVTWNGTSWSNPANCEWNCNSGYTLDGGSVCINEKQVACAESGAPDNASYTSGNVTVTWNGTSWTEPANCTWDCNPGYMEINGVCEKVGNMELVYNGLVSGDVVELPFHGTVNLQSVDCGVGGTWNEVKNGYTTCTYGVGVNSGDINIQVTAKATGFGGYNTKGIEKLKKVTKIENMGFRNLYYAFEGAVKLESIPNTNWTKDVTNMNFMFYNARVFNQDLDNWDTSNVTDMDGMFINARTFNGNINSWNVSKVTNMKSMFFNALNFNKPLNNWNTSSLTTMEQMFEGAKLFNQSLNNWDTSKVTSMNGIFEHAINFNNGGEDFNIDTSNVTDMVIMFHGASSFNQKFGEKFNTANVTNMRGMFQEATNFNQPLNNFNTANVTDMSSMFSLATNFNQNLNCWNVAKVTNHIHFNLQSGLEDINLPKWGTTGVGNCTRPGTMELVYNGLVSGDVVELPFRGTVNLQSVDCGVGGTWNEVKNGYTTCTYGVGVNSGDTIIKVDGKSTGYGKLYGILPKTIGKLKAVNSWKDMGFTDLSRAFYGAENLIKVPNDDGTKNVTNMYQMFSSAKNFNQNLDNWNTSKVTNMSFMFRAAHNFNNGDTAGASNKPLNFDTSNVTNMSNMFNRAFVFNQKFGPKFNTINVTDMQSMFNSAKKFNQPLSSWNTSNVIKMGQGVSTIGNSNFAGMFESADSFNQNLNCWNVTKVTDYINFNKDSGLSLANLPKWGTAGIGTCQ